MENWNYRLSGWKFLYRFNKFFYMPSKAHVLLTFFPSNIKSANTRVLRSLHVSYFTTYYSSLVKAFELLSASVFPLFVLSSLICTRSCLGVCLRNVCKRFLCPLRDKEHTLSSQINPPELHKELSPYVSSQRVRLSG